METSKISMIAQPRPSANSFTAISSRREDHAFKLAATNISATIYDLATTPLGKCLAAMTLLRGQQSVPAPLWRHIDDPRGTRCSLQHAVAITDITSETLRSVCRIYYAGGLEATIKEGQIKKFPAQENLTSTIYIPTRKIGH